jgi:hypothetical protein
MSDLKLLEQEVFGALALIEQFEQLVVSLESFKHTLKGKAKTEMELHLSTLKSLVNLLDEDGNSVDNTSAKMSGNLPTSEIERLGIGGELLRLRQQGTTIKKLAEMYNLQSHQVSRFFKRYDQAKPKEKVRLQRTSVFDTTQQLEELMVVIRRQAARLEGVNDDVNVKVLGEWRQVIQLAAQLAEKMANAERFQQFTATVYEILATELPARRTEILKKISAVGHTKSNSLLDVEVRPVLPEE